MMISLRAASCTDGKSKSLADGVLSVLTAIYGVDQSPWTRPQILSDLSRPETGYFLAFDGDRVVGFLASQTVLDERDITMIAVRPDYQRQGIASQLLAMAVAFDGSIFLEVRASNVTAQKLYQKFDFLPYRARKNYYRNPTENAILMKRESCQKPSQS